MGKFDILKRAIKGELLKCRLNLNWNREISKAKSPKATCPVTVSLTSYGFRIEKIVPYAILSIFKQNVRPERIVLCIDGSKWNDSNIPAKLKDLQSIGLEIDYCKDVRSFTKIVPTLRRYPDSTIVTIDDDLYYSSGFIEEIYNRSLEKPGCIITENFCYPTFRNGEVDTYRNWKEFHVVAADNSFSRRLIFPQGFGGVLYPSHSLHEDATDEKLFLSMSPHADDIWLYVQGLLKNTPKEPVPDTKTRYYFLDLFRQMRTKDRLHDLNVGEDMNDVQLKRLLNHYKLSLQENE